MQTRNDAPPTAALRVLAVHRYYWPDTAPYASLLRQIVQHWVSEGHQVDVLSSQPSYKAGLSIDPRPGTETVDGAHVRRLALPNESGRPFVRIFNAARLGLTLMLQAFRQRYDVIMISTAPPVLGGFMAALAARLTGARFIYHCMDLHPEIGRVSGEFANPLVYKILSFLDRYSCSRADPVVVLSADMKNTLEQRRDGDQFCIRVLNNFSLPSSQEPVDDLPFEIDETALTVLFAGNIGRFQSLHAVIDAMALVKDRPDVEFILMGEGTAKPELERRAEKMGARVRFVGHQPLEVAKAAMRRVNFGFVSLTPDVYRYAFPSKTMTYLEQGCPVIVAVEQDSELAQDAVAGGYGHWVPTNDGPALAALLRSIAADKSSIASMSQKAFTIAESEFSEAVMLPHWTSILHGESEESI